MTQFNTCGCMGAPPLESQRAHTHERFRGRRGTWGCEASQLGMRSGSVGASKCHCRMRRVTAAVTPLPRVQLTSVDSVVPVRGCTVSFPSVRLEA